MNNLRIIIANQTIKQIIVLSFFGIYSKFYRGFFQEWVNDYSGDILYEMFWCLLIFWLMPYIKKTILIPTWVFIITSLIEISQLWRSPFLQFIRSFFIGRLLIGTTFSWWDFPHYLLGSFLGYLWIRTIKNHLK